MSIQRHEQTARWSKLVVRGRTAYLAGLVADSWDAGIREQTQEVLAQVDALLAKAGADKSTILTMTFFIKDMADYPAFNEVYDAWVDPNNLPARATMKCELIDPRIRIEVLTVAAIEG